VSKAFAIVCIVLLALTGRAEAFELVPIVMDFTPSGAGASQTFRIINTDNAPIAVEASTFEVSMDLDGKEERKPADDLFVLYPPQMVVMPARTQNLRVKWVGPAKLDRERVFRLIAEQLPVQLQRNENAGARINLLLRYEGLLYITPPGAKADLSLASVEPVKDSSGKPMLAVTISNSGNAHGRLVDPILKVSAGAASVTLGPERLGDLVRASILPESKRRFMIPWPKELPVRPVDAKFADYKVER